MCKWHRIEDLETNYIYKDIWYRIEVLLKIGKKMIYFNKLYRIVDVNMEKN